MILKFINLKQAHTNTIYNIFEKTDVARFEMFWKIFSVKIILKLEKWVKNSKN